MAYLGSNSVERLDSLDKAASPEFWAWFEQQLMEAQAVPMPTFDAYLLARAGRREEACIAP
jgi:hypothetical protein